MSNQNEAAQPKHRKNKMQHATCHHNVYLINRPSAHLVFTSRSSTLCSSNESISLMIPAAFPLP